MLSDLNTLVNVIVSQLRRGLPGKDYLACLRLAGPDGSKLTLNATSEAKGRGTRISEFICRAIDR